jgi:hypothetical protein
MEAIAQLSSNKEIRARNMVKEIKSGTRNLGIF